MSVMGLGRWMSFISFLQSAWVLIVSFAYYCAMYSLPKNMTKARGQSLKIPLKHNDCAPNDHHNFIVLVTSLRPFIILNFWMMAYFTQQPWCESFEIKQVIKILFIAFFSNERGNLTHPSVWPEGKRHVENHITLCLLNDWQSYQRNRKGNEKKTAWRNTVIAYWKAARGEARCPWHAWNSIQPLSNFSVQDAVARPRWHFQAISYWWAKFMQHNTDLRGSLRLMVTPFGQHQNEVKNKYVRNWRKGKKGWSWHESPSVLLQVGISFQLHTWLV